MSTTTVLVLLFGYHTSTSSENTASAGSSAVAPVGGTTTTGGSSSSSSGSSTTDPGSASTDSGSSSGSTATATYTGNSASTRWGPVQVEITVADGTITDVQVVDYPDNNGKDKQINARALPVLVKETLAAQGAGIDMVSGATVTSDGYVESLQSALDKAGL